MNIKFLILLLTLTLLISCGSSDDALVQEDPKEESPNPDPDPVVTYDKIEVPANPGTGMKWEFQEDLSDDFEYEYAGESTLSTFGGGKWTNFYHNTWQGPGPTIWRHENATASGGNFHVYLKAERLAVGPHFVHVEKIK